MNSTAITAIGYDKDRRNLGIQFEHGGVYSYHNVPEEVYKAFMAAPSKGHFFQERIKDVYQEF